MATSSVAVEPSVLASALLAACAAIATLGPPAPNPARPPRGNVVGTLAPEMSVRFDAEAAWLLDPQLCLDAFVWFHTGASPAVYEPDLVRCWR